MFEIIIAFIIIGIIGNILKGIGQASQWERTQQPVPKSTTDNQIPRVGGRMADINGYSSKNPGGVKDRVDDTGVQEDSPVGGQSIYTSSDSGIQEQHRITKYVSERQNKLSFSRDSMINGIIISEILLPPRSRRRR